jgi:hypothetical protein
VAAAKAAAAAAALAATATATTTATASEVLMHHRSSYLFFSSYRGSSKKMQNHLLNEVRFPMPLNVWLGR